MKQRSPTAEAAQLALALALGREVEFPASVDWRRVQTLARAERLSALAWQRGGEQIRRCAPAEVTARWRAEALAAVELADRQRKALSRIADATARRQVNVLVLKGLPLADRLYGDPSARLCCDIDLFVPRSDRPAADQLLTGLGWTRWYGASPYDASYRLSNDLGTLFLELHSFLTSEALEHCPLSPEREGVWSCAGTPVRTLDGPVVAVYLAANIAKHGTPPLLSYLDLATFWGSLTANEREDARRLAKHTRLARCLQWALRRAAALDAGASGDDSAFRTLGFHGERRRSSHSLLRLMWLADRPADAARILGTWTWPRPLRSSGDAIMPFWGRRMRRSFAGRFRYMRGYDPDAATGS